MNDLDFTSSPETVTESAKRLIETLRSIGSCVIAFSGGVDSSVVAAAAYFALHEHCIAVTGVGAAVSQLDREFALEVVAYIGMRHEFLATSEIENRDYQRNDSQRCFHCKSELYSRLQAYADARSIPAIVSGTNADDLGDYRPGLVAGQKHRVATPLADLGLRKNAIRNIARHWGLPVADRPAAPCLSSRVAYGTEVTQERLSMIEQAEAILHSLGFNEVRVRLHDSQLARIEIRSDQLTQFCAAVDMKSISTKFQAIGFRYVTLDLAGFQSGSLNLVLNRDNQPKLSLPIW